MTPPPGLCATCRYVRLVHTKRSAIFYLCNRSTEEPCFAKYPTVPVLCCSGYINDEKEQAADER